MSQKDLEAFQRTTTLFSIHIFLSLFHIKRQKQNQLTTILRRQDFRDSRELLYHIDNSTALDL